MRGKYFFAILLFNKKHISFSKQQLLSNCKIFISTTYRPPDPFTRRVQFGPMKNTRNKSEVMESRGPSCKSAPPSVSLHVAYILRQPPCPRTYPNTRMHICTHVRKSYRLSRLVHFLTFPFISRMIFKYSLRRARFAPRLHCPGKMHNA